MDYRGVYRDLQLLDLEAHLAALKGKVGVSVDTQAFIAFIRELTAFKRELEDRGYAA